MAGQPGKSGGARKGAGRKPRVAVKTTMEAQPHGGALKREAAEPIQIPECDILTMLQNVALGRVEATALQVRAAIAAVQYTHTKKGDGGKKEEQESKAKKAGTGKFASAAPPKLVVNNKP
jgi:phage terminase small subunit